ncbi:MAG: type II secretion system protein GspM [Gammaproteobacteria bacterium]
MRTWLEKLSSRERSALALATLALVGFSFYWFFWQPMNAEQDRLRARLKEQSAALVWMQQAANEARRLRGEDLPTLQKREDESLLTLVDRTARQFIADGLNRLEPEGEHAVKVWLKEVDFDDLVRWLQELQTEWGVQANVVSLQRMEQQGLVTGRLVLHELME